MSDGNTLGTYLDSNLEHVRDAIRQANEKISRGDDHDLKNIENMVEQLTQHLRHNIGDLSEADRLSFVSELKELVEDFDALEEAIIASGGKAPDVENPSADENPQEEKS